MIHTGYGKKTDRTGLNVSSLSLRSKKHGRTIKLKINYDIVTKVTDTSNLTSTITNKEVSLPKNTFKKGTKHTYVLTIKMNAIKITVEDNMEGWTDDSDSDINVEK